MSHLEPYESPKSQWVMVSLMTHMSHTEPTSQLGYICCIFGYFGLLLISWVLSHRSHNESWWIIQSHVSYWVISNFQLYQSIWVQSIIFNATMYHEVVEENQGYHVPWGYWGEEEEKETNCTYWPACCAACKNNIKEHIYHWGWLFFHQLLFLI